LEVREPQTALLLVLLFVLGIPSRGQGDDELWPDFMLHQRQVVKEGLLTDTSCAVGDALCI
jgi:hypothetical protein